MRHYYSISNILIILSILATIAVTLNRELYSFGMNTFFLDRGIYHIYILQFFSSQFLHGGLLHLFSNAIFIGYFGNVLEGLIGRVKFLSFFIFTSLFNGLAITYLSEGNTVGISGFALALLTYYALEMKSRADFQESKGALTAIVINIGIGFAPGISLIGHASGAFAGILYYYINKNFFRPKFIGKQENYQDILSSKGVAPEMSEKI